MHGLSSQIVFRQYALRQSEASMQCLSFSHFTQGPPQSTSVSKLETMLSWQVTSESQAMAQVPPQSVPSSPSSSWPFAHSIGTQMAALHAPSTQSPPKSQRLPIPHGGQAEPPQSTSVSVPPLSGPSFSSLPHVVGTHCPSPHRF